MGNDAEVSPIVPRRICFLLVLPARFYNGKLTGNIFYQMLKLSHENVYPVHYTLYQLFIIILFQ